MNCRCPRPIAYASALALSALALVSAAAPQVGGRPGAPPAAPPAPAAVEDGMAVFFSPEGGCADALIELLRGAKRTVDVQAYYLTHTRIAKALGEAHERGVKVRVVLDEKAAGEQYSAATYLSDHGVPVWLDGAHQIAHNKIILVDGETIVTGSLNFTKSADEQHAENLLLVNGKRKLMAAYQANFERHLKHAKKYQRPGGK